MHDISASSAYRSTPIAFGGWLLAGLPILASAIQAIARLNNTLVESWPLLGPVSAGLKQVEVFKQMALAFNPESLIVLILFPLISISWIALGLSLFRPFKFLRDHSREVRGGSVLATTVLYGLLFFGSYWQLLTSSISTIGVAAIGGLPAVVFTGIYLAYRVQPRTNGNRLLNIAEQKINAIERELAASSKEINSQLNKLDTELKQEILTDTAERTVESTSNNVPNREVLPVASAEKDVRQMEGAIKNYRGRIEEIRTYPEAKREREADELLRKEISSIPLKITVQSAENKIKETLSDWLTDTCVTRQFRSDKWDRPYALNEHGEYRYITYSPGGTPSPESDQVGVDDIADWATDGNQDPVMVKINVNEITELADQLTRDSVPIETTVLILNEVKSHFDGVQDDLRQREAEFVEVTDEINAELDRARGTIADLPGQLGNLLEKIYISGVDDGINDIRSITQQDDRIDDRTDGGLDRAIDLHHSCRFDMAIKVAEEARERARQLNQVVNFIKQITLTAEEGVDSFTIPEFNRQTNPFFTRDLIEQKVNARINGVEIDPDWPNGRLEYRYDNGSTGEVEVAESPDDEQSDAVVQDGVRWLFNSLKSESIGATRESLPGEDGNGRADATVKIRRESLPEIKAHPEIIHTAADHIDHQSKIGAQVDRSKMPDVLAFDVWTEGEAIPSQRQIGDELLESFKNRPDYKIDNLK